MTDRGLGIASMGKASRTKVDATRREKIAAQRAAERRSEQRRRILIASGSVVVVLVIVLVFVIVKLNGGKPNSATGASNGPTGSALAAVVDKTTSVPASALNSVGDGGGAVTGKPTTISGTALTSSGKPEMFYMGAEYCPYCAAERWAMIVALSRFGTFSGLSTVHSSSTDVDPNTPTFSFYKSSYTSQYLTFTPVELTTNVPDSSNPSGYVTLQTPTAAQQALVNKYDGSGGSIPFIDFGNKYVISGVSYDPGVLDGLSWATIANDLSNPNSAVAKAVDGTANYITAAICKMTNNLPASACTTTVQSLQSQI
jgi:thiol-disulfide isomerase/thioredoxin